MIRRGKRMRPFRRIAVNFCNITNTGVTFRGAAGVGRLAADAEDRNSKNCRRRRRLFKTLVVQDVITDAVLSPDIIDAAPSNRSKKKPQPTPRHCRLTGLNHALTYSNLAPISWRSEKLRRSPCTGHQVYKMCILSHRSNLSNLANVLQHFRNIFAGCVVEIFANF